MKSIRFYCDRGSLGLINLRNALREAGVDCKRIKRRGSTYRPRLNHTIINWGCSSIPYATYLNSAAAIAKASNKLKTFKTLEGSIPIPTYFEEQRAASIFIEGNPETTIFCRSKLSGHSGVGITISRTKEELVEAPLYTVGIQNGGEFRVHVFRNLNTDELEVIDITKKRRRTELMEQEGGINSDIRNVRGGWVYCHNNVELPESVQVMAKSAVETLGLDFGAVDIIREKNTDNYYVLEVNSAPGLSSPTTLAAYVNIIKKGLEV